MSLFVTGTDTDVGKTVISAALCLKLKWDYWKPVQSGEPADSSWVSEHISPHCAYPEAYRLSRPLSPDQAARYDGLKIDVDGILAKAPPTPTVIEGAGGLLVPFNDTHLTTDLIAALRVPLLLVARSGLGTINHTLLSLEAARRRNLTVVGVVLVGDPHPDNRRSIERHGGQPVLGEIPKYPQINRQTLEVIGDLLGIDRQAYKTLEGAQP
jgi:dethiobiotin synthetase